MKTKSYAELNPMIAQFHGLGIPFSVFKALVRLINPVTNAKAYRYTHRETCCKYVVEATEQYMKRWFYAGASSETTNASGTTCAAI